MRKSVKYEFIEAIRFARKNNSRNDISYYLSGSKKKRTMLYEMLEKFIDDAKIDYELGILCMEEYHVEMKAAEIIKKSLENYRMY